MHDFYIVFMALQEKNRLTDNLPLPKRHFGPLQTISPLQHFIDPLLILSTQCLLRYLILKCTKHIRVAFHHYMLRSSKPREPEA